MSAVLARATALFSSVGTGAPRTDAELLASYVLNVPRGRLVLAGGFDARQRADYEALVRRRAAGEPVQHLTGSAGFRYLELVVGPGVFVPRPETELLVDTGLAAVAHRVAPRVVDLCAGSGALGLSMAHERRDALVHLVEADPDALCYLGANARRRQEAGDPPSQVVTADATAPGLLAELAGQVDLVLSNPPYVPLGTSLPVDVAGADPDRALYGGPDGLAVVRPLIERAADLLRPGGALVIEHDDTHGEAVPELIAADGRFTTVRPHRDLSGRPRYASARRG